MSAHPLPIVLAPQRDVIPHAYVIHKRSQLCRCGTLHEWSELYSKTHLRSRLGEGKYITNLRPVYTPSDIYYNLPIEIVVRDQTKVLFCHECAAPESLTHLPRPPADDTGRLVGNHLGLPEAKPKTPSKPKPTIDDLLI